MCWMSNSSDLTAQVAVDDIPVFKICRKHLSGHIFPYYFGSKLTYYKGFSYTSAIRPFKDDLGLCAIDKGLHSYSPECSIKKDRAINWFKVLSAGCLFRVGEYCISDCSSFGTCMLLCVIPKRAVYYVNERGEYVSDKLTVIDEVEWRGNASYWNKVLKKWIYRINIL